MQDKAATADPVVEEEVTMPPPSKQEEDAAADDDEEEETPPRKQAHLFHIMAAYPWPFMVILPAVFCLLIGFGWTQDNVVEDQVANIWIPRDGTLATNSRYMEDLGLDNAPSSIAAAMAIARDGNNLFTDPRLQEIQERMKRVDAIEIDYNGHTFTWDDLCASNPAPYNLPCPRLTAMDLFQESRWSWSDAARAFWYQNVIQRLLVQPRIPRFGVLTNNCLSATDPAVGVCNAVYALRTNPEALGLPAESANPLLLFADIGNLEMSDPCRICIERGYQGTIEQLYEAIIPSFQVLSLELQRYLASLSDADTIAATSAILQKTAALSSSITKDDVADFYRYYVTRTLYAQFGVAGYMDAYSRLAPLLSQCPEGMACPPLEITEADALAALLKHADNVFSSVTTAGAPFPFWSNGDGTGSLWMGNQPVSGSGIDMSADLFSLPVAYLDLANVQDQTVWSPAYTAGFADPNSTEWATMVEVNPIYAWFMASMEDMPQTTACGNGVLTGTQTGVEALDGPTAAVFGGASQEWCTPYDLPNTDDVGTGGPYTKQHFARMWYDLVIASPDFLNLQQGQDDPYTWTTGQGCGYNLAGTREIFTNQTEEAILKSASREIYYIDEGSSVGVVDPNLLVGGAVPAIGEYSQDNPLKEVTVVQTLYASLVGQGIVDRVRHCLRPDGPIDITEDDAREVLALYKEEFDAVWSECWDDDNCGEVEFVNFIDDVGAGGSASRMLTEITLDNSKLTIISITFITVFSALFLFSFDMIESRILITIVGVALVVLSYFAAVGFSILLGTKINVTIAWTLPFIILGLGVDDVYIVLASIRDAGGYTEEHWLEAMKEVVMPVTMTSLVNVCMFSVMTASDIPAIYLTAQVAAFCVIALYLSVILCFPAYCYMDRRRQANGRRDVLFCLKQENASTEPAKEDFRSVALYDMFYRPIMLGESKTRMISHAIVWLLSAGLFAVGIYGITQRKVGLGLEDFFPSSNQAGRWATFRTESMSSWSIDMNWGALSYEEPDTQMRMIRQFEDVVESPHLAEIDTHQLWMADFLLWTSTHCDADFDRPEFEVRRCGNSKFHEESQSFCTATWMPNTFGLRIKQFSDPEDPMCYPFEGGICRPTDRMHFVDIMDLGSRDITPVEGDTFCPTADGWSDDKWQFCLREWRSTTGYSGGRFLFQEEKGTETACGGVFATDENFVWPIPYSASPGLFAYDLGTHEETLEMMEQTRAICEEDNELSCWMTGIPYNYWTQYQNIFPVLIELAGYATLVGFGIAFVFLYGKVTFEKQHWQGEMRRRHTTCDIFLGSLIGALLIATSILLSLVSIVGISIISGVNLTGFSNMSFVLSVGFSVEYSVHIIMRWMLADSSHQSSLDRVRYSMEFLMLPTFMSFVSSSIGVITLAFTEFSFTDVFFFRPLLITMLVTYWFGCWWLPSFLCYIDLDAVKLGSEAAVDYTDDGLDKEVAVASEDSDDSPAKVNDVET